jgi:hypothetical protein
LAIWGNANDLAQAIVNINKETQFAPHQSEMMMWLLDTLDSIDIFPPKRFEIYLKGGTCVQHYLPSESQRFSMDLDFSVCFQENVDIPQKATIVKEYLRELNGELLKSGWRADHGTMKIPETPLGFTSICFCGRIFQPTKCRKTVSKILGVEDAAFVKTEFFLHGHDPEYSRQKLLLVSANYAVRDVFFNLASKTRLLADKIVALSGEGYGARDENKDIIDLKALSELNGIDLTLASNMITGWAQSHLDQEGNLNPIDPPARIIHAARQTVTARSEITDEALAQMTGLLYARGRPGFNLSRNDWRSMCLQVVAFLDKRVLPLFD